MRKLFCFRVGYFNRVVINFIVLGYLIGSGEFLVYDLVLRYLWVKFKSVICVYVVFRKK